MREKTRELTCVVCPMSCRARVVFEGGEVIAVKGVGCPRGEAYARGEVMAPVRDFFTTVRVRGGKFSMLPVRTTMPVPKERVMDIAVELSKITVEAPVKLGQVIMRDILNLNVDVIATRALDVV
ncbi:MAG: hypothetical protein QG670_1894 [Thermoproteota archaeon]|nr:hypothetical protein [Thermoproteota archaeon]